MPTLRYRIRRKIYDCKTKDLILQEICPDLNANLATITIEEGFQLIKKSGKFCPGCNCKMKFKNFEPWCLYQFTFNRLDNNIIHCLSNLEICCYRCNSYGYGKQKIRCIKGCHQ